MPGWSTMAAQVRRHPHVSLAAAVGGPLAVGLIAWAATSAGAAGTVPRPAAAVVSPAHTPPRPAPVAALAASVAGGATSVDTQAPVTVTATHGRITSVTLTPAGGTAVPGTFAPSGTSWSSAGHLAIETSYTLRATAVNAVGKATTSTESFTTLTPSRILRVQDVQPTDGETVGVGEPVIVEFESYVPAAYRAAVERAMTVTTSTHVPGAWSWISDTRVDWRPQSYWTPGTRVRVGVDLDGVKAGATQYGDKDVTYGFTIGTDVESVADPATHTFKVYENGRLVRTMPTSGGMPGLATWQGTFAVMGKDASVRMTSCSSGLSCTPGVGDYYDSIEYDAVQFTDSGSYVHAASWDGELGVANTSHGCLHLSNANAAWFYDLSKTGDILTVAGTGRPVAPGNGTTDWTEPWSQWLSASAAGVQSS